MKTIKLIIFFRETDQPTPEMTTETNGDSSTSVENDGPSETSL